MRVKKDGNKDNYTEDNRQKIKNGNTQKQSQKSYYIT